jgi:DNA-binding CsgD family transcriptional regulator
MFRRPAYGHHWNARDDERLRELAAGPASDGEIAVALGRSRQSVEERRRYLSLSRRT